MRVVVPALALLLLLPIVAFFVPPVAAETVHVSVSNFAFTPTTVDIEQGDTVQWNWASGTHSVVQEGGTTWCSVRSSGSCTRTFPTAGTYNYFCSVHPGPMRATVRVAGPPPTITIDAPADGATLSGTFVVSGTAASASGVTKVDVRIGSGPFLPATGTTAWSISIDSSTVSNGAKTVTARVTAGDGQTATDAIGITINNPDLRDLQLVTMSGTTSFTGHPIISFSVRNNGNIDLTSKVRFEYLYKGQWHFIRDFSIQKNAFTTQNYQTTWDDPVMFGRFDIRGTVDPTDVIVETNEGNNVRQHSAAFYTNALNGIDPRDP